MQRTNYFLLVFLLIFTFTSNLYAGLKMDIQGGRNKVEILIANVKADNIDNLNLAYEIEELIKSQLEATKIFKFYNEAEQTKKNLSFFQKFINSFRNELITDKFFIEISSNSDNSLNIKAILTEPDSLTQNNNNKTSPSTHKKPTRGSPSPMHGFKNDYKNHSNAQIKSGAELKTESKGAYKEYVTEGRMDDNSDEPSTDASFKNEYWNKELINIETQFQYKNWHNIAAQISDQIFKHYTGIEGYIDSTLLYVSEKGKKKRKYRISMMDLYGANHRYFSNGKNIVLSPKLSPDGKKILYLSFADKRPTLYLLDIATKTTAKLVDFAGMLYAPNFSPDGKKIVLSASYEGNSEIAIFNLETKKLSRITRNYAIDTSPDFSPDSKKIVFSSDRSGVQNLYIMDINGKNLQRINFSAGSYNDPAWSPDGKYIAFTKIYKNKFHIGIVNITNNQSYILTTGYKDEAPTWAPNSKFLIFTRYKKNKKRNSELLLVNLNGMIIGKISTPYNASDPHWR